MKIKSTFFQVLNLLILSFFAVAIPAYYFFQNTVVSQIRNVHFLASQVISVFLFIIFLKERKNNSVNFPLLLLFVLFGWILLVLLISINDYGIEWARSDVISLCYCFQALILGVNLTKISNGQFFLSFIFIVWLIHSCLIFSKVDPLYMQAIYGKDDESFSGSYQYIGDIYAFLSVMLISGSIGVFKELRHKQFNSLNSIQKEIKGSIILPMILLVISLVLLFLNGSRASLFSFLVFSIYILHHLLKKVSLSKIILGLFLLLSLSLMLLGFKHDLLVLDLNYDALLSNRNFELLTEGHSTSAEGRTEFYELGMQDIANNPITGNYIERNLYRGKGSYMHDFLALVQDFGVFVFLSYGCLVFYCVKHFFQSSIKSQDHHSITYNGFLAMSITEVIFFREPLGFYPMFFNFGMMLRTLAEKHQ